MISRGDTLHVRLRSGRRLPALRASMSERRLKPSELKRDVRRFAVDRTADGLAYSFAAADLQPGETTVTFHYGNSRRTWAKV